MLWEGQIVKTDVDIGEWVNAQMLRKAVSARPSCKKQPGLRVFLGYRQLAICNSESSEGRDRCNF